MKTTGRYGSLAALLVLAACNGRTVTQAVEKAERDAAASVPEAGPTGDAHYIPGPDGPYYVTIDAGKGDAHYIPPPDGPVYFETGPTNPDASPKCNPCVEAGPAKLPDAACPPACIILCDADPQCLANECGCSM